MKRKIVYFAVLVLIALMTVYGCKKKGPASPSNPSGPAGTATITPTATMNTAIDNTVYNFENGTTMGWTVTLDTSAGITGTANSSFVAKYGSHSLAVECNFTASTSNDTIGVVPTLPYNDMTGKTLVGWVYIPAGAPSLSGTLYIKTTTGGHWAQGPWITYQTGWNKMTMDPNNPGWTDGNPIVLSQLIEIGFKIAPTSAGTVWAGSCYVDSVDFISVPPTATPSVTLTLTPASPTDTITPGGPTFTITQTHTVSPTITITSTYISTPIAPNDPNIQYYGRWNLTNPVDARNGWGTTYMITNFSGTSIAINLSTWDSWYAYAIDDFSNHAAFTKFRVKNQSDQQTPVATQTPLVITGLPDGLHSIMIVRRTEGNGGIVDFTGFSLDTGKTLSAPPAWPTRKMEFIGDSITCGSADEYNAAVPTATADLPCPYGGCIQNGDMAFGPQLARLFNAEGRTISRGGIGMYRNCPGCDPPQTMPQVYPYMYFESSPSAGSLTWNFASWQADVVVIALGTNDFSAGVPDQTAFDTAYSGFLAALRSYYPNADILCTEPIPSWVGATAGTYISGVVSGMSDSKIYYVPINNPSIAAGFPLQTTEYAGDNTHPLVAAHTKIANALYAWITGNTALMTDLTTNHGW